MSSYTTYSTDVFISYGHTDNVGGWITDLHSGLEVRLRQLLGLSDQDLVVWRDPRLERVGAYEPQLQRKICDSAVFLSVVTPRYLTSESCRKELEWFVAGNCDRLETTEAESRLIRVGKTWLRDATLPREFTASLGFNFFAQDPFNPEEFHEFGSQPTHSGHDQFAERIETLAQAAARLLYKIRRNLSAANTKSRASGKQIFLAPTAVDMRSNRESIANELRNRGFQVLSCDPLPETGPELRAQTEALLDTADAAIHLAGSRYGSVPELENESYAEIVYEMASTRRGHSSLQQMVWVPENLQVVELRQQSLLARLRNMPDPSNSNKLELFQTSLESFKEGILDLLLRKEPEELPRSINAKAVYLLCDQSDLLQENLEKIKSYLRERGHPVELPAFQGEPNELTALEEEVIADTDAALIYYGKATDTWVKLKRQKIRKILSNSSVARGYTRALYLANPEDDIKAGNYLNIGDRKYLEPGLPPLLLLGDCGEFHPETLRPFLQVLES